MVLVFKLQPGSPPQVRVKEQWKWHKANDNRITPAGAGKSDNKEARIYSNSGSPPQVRVKDGNLIERDRNARITPAGAGKSTLKRRTYHQD